MSGSNKVAILGTHIFGWRVLKYLLENKIKISYIVTVSSKKAKYFNISGYKDFKDLALLYNIPIYYVDKYSLNSKIDYDFFDKNRFDLVINGGWQRLIPNKILETFTIGAIGEHGSSDFLPKGRGRSPMNWSLIEGKKRFIMHYFLMKSNADDGDIFYYEMYDINEWDDISTLYYKNSILSKKVLLKWIPKLLSNDYKVVPQTGTPTYYPKRTSEDGLIDFTLSVYEIHNFVRALTKPYPGAYTYLNSLKIIIWKAQVFDTRISYHKADIGEIVEIFENKDFIIKCNSGLLLITLFQIESSYCITIGDILKKY